MNLLAITSGERIAFFQDMVCGGCGLSFSANPRTVPCFQNPNELGPRRPCCGSCWAHLNGMRIRANLLPWSRPLCYPEDYPT